MKYINIDECLAKIDAGRIDRNNFANVYLGGTSREIVLEMAYSQKTEDHIVLKKIQLPEDRTLHEEIWVEYLAVSMLIAFAYNIQRFVDDIRCCKMEGSDE